MSNPTENPLQKLAANMANLPDGEFLSTTARIMIALASVHFKLSGGHTDSVSAALDVNTARLNTQFKETLEEISLAINTSGDIGALLPKMRGLKETVAFHAELENRYSVLQKNVKDMRAEGEEQDKQMKSYIEKLRSVHTTKKDIAPLHDELKKLTTEINETGKDADLLLQKLIELHNDAYIKIPASEKTDLREPISLSSVRKLSHN